jgi:NAD(P)H-flavin reductase
VFEILSKRELAPNVHELVVRAPRIAEKARAGQFVILMADDEAERVPFTLSDWDADAGTVTLVVLEVGRSSRRVIAMAEGERLAHLAGPLGRPLEVDRFGRVAVLGGCYGIGAIVCIAKALKAAGNEVLAVVEARSHYLHYYRERLSAEADEVVRTTTDGSAGAKGHASDELVRRLAAGETFDRVVVVGCPFTMMLVAEETRPHGIPTRAALNTIMVDGTGMCGACRVKVGDASKLACVDGPFFDAHAVDWENVLARRRTYREEEVGSLERAAHGGHPEPRGSHAHAHHGSDSHAPGGEDAEEP